MENYIKPISHSGLSLFKQCRKRWHNSYILGNFEPPGDAAKRGTEIHKKIEDYFNTGIYPDIEVLYKWKPYMEQLYAKSPKPEQKIAVNDKWESVDFYSEDAFFRGIADLIIENNEEIRIIDWKTGKKYPEHRKQGVSYIALCSEKPIMYAECVYIDTNFNTHKTEYTKDQRDDHVSQIISDINIIRSCEIFDASSGSHCYWCSLSWRKGGDCLNAK
jgi:hypothetical protein